MVDRNSAAAADNAVAEDLSDEDFLWGDDTATSENTEPTAEEIAAGTETSEELADPEAEVEVVEETAAPAQPGQVPPAQPAAVAPTPAPAPVTQQAPTSVEPQQRAPLFHEMVNANFDAAVDHVAAQKIFSLSPQDAEVLDPEALAIMEKQSARVYLRTMASVSELIHNTLPSVVHSLIGITNEGKSVADQFMEEYGFSREAHGQQLTSVVGYLRQSEPHLDRPSLMRKAAQMTHALNGTQMPAPKAPGAQPPKAPNGAAKPGQKVIARKAFTPASKTAGGGAPTSRVAGTPPKPVDPLANLNAMLKTNFDE